MALEPAKLSDFLLSRALGSGTTAKVFEAVHTATRQVVAIKMMDASGHAPAGEMRERFAREALLLSGVESRHVSKILGFGFEKGQPFLVLERLHGETLDAKLRRDGPVAPLIGARWMEQLIIGIRDCHDANVIHRDIKPSNLFICSEGGREEAKLIDFGVARLREITGGVFSLTSSNHLIGSMGYMAPEQFHNAHGVGFQADLYAIGVVIYRALTGRLPFVSRTLDGILKMKTEQTPPLISSMGGALQNAMLDWFVQRALMREPEARFQNARDMLDNWRNVMASLEAVPPGRDAAAEHPANLDDNTIQTPARAFSTGDTLVRPPPKFDDTVRSETAPVSDLTLAQGSVQSPQLDEDPTGRFANVGELVERELELERTRKQKG
jgi:serine/threonine-protein kinase